MRRPVEEMTERELLEELVQEKRLQETLRRVRLGVYAVLAVAAAVLLAIYLPPVVRYFRQLSTTLQQIRQAVEQASAALDSVRQTVAGIEEGGAAALQSAADRLNELIGGISAWFR